MSVVLVLSDHEADAIQRAALAELRVEVRHQMARRSRGRHPYLEDLRALAGAHRRLVRQQRHCIKRGRADAEARNRLACLSAQAQAVEV